MAAAWRARKSIRLDYCKRIASRLIKNGSLKRLIHALLTKFVGDTLSRTLARTGLNTSISTDGSKLTFPDFGQKFDLVTAFMICFNNHKMPGLWKSPEWEFFLNDLSKHVTPRGRVWLELNEEYDGTFYTPELKTFFEERGAQINEHKVIFSSGLRAPLSASPTVRQDLRGAADAPR